MLYLISKFGKLVLFSSAVAGSSYPIISQLSNKTQIPNKQEIEELKKKKVCPVVPKYKEESCEVIILDIY